MKPAPPNWFWCVWIVTLWAALLSWPAHGAVDVKVYARVVVCSDDLLLCDVLPPVAYEAWEDCERHLVVAGVERERDGVVMGKCRSWSPAPDWREE